MAYVRTKGNQVLLVHGVRSRDTGAVDQQTLFTFYTKAELQAAMGEHSKVFRDQLEADHPDLRFNWQAIDAGLREHLDHVPDAAPDQRTTAAVELRQALVELARVTWELSPSELQSAKELVDANRAALKLTVGRLQSLLSAPPPMDSEFTRDTPSLWRQARRARAIPLHGWEQLAELWHRCEYPEAEALAGLLSEAFPMFADARNYLGLAAMERGDLPASLRHFLDAEAVGRKQFPRRIAKSRYWSDHDTRPFLRALIHQVTACNRMGEYKKALDVCDRLERDHGQDIYAAALRVPVLLNDRQWSAAALHAEQMTGLYPENHVLLALAGLELHDHSQAQQHFVRCALELPATVGLLLGMRLHSGMLEDARDHNHGVSLLRDTKAYRTTHDKSLQYFRKLWSHPVVKAAVLEADEVRQKSRTNRSGERTWFDRMQRLHSMEHAREVVAAMDEQGQAFAAANATNPG